MTPAARAAAAIAVLDRIAEGIATEAALLAWARGARFAGSKDRAAVRDLVFEARRKWRSSAAFGGCETGRGRILGLLRRKGDAPEALFDGAGYGPAPLTEAETVALAETPALDPAMAADLPDWLWDVLVQSYGDQAASLAATLAERAPMFVRVNLTKTTPEAARALLAEEGVEAQACQTAQTALEILSGGRRLKTTQAFLDGLVEVQDAASQAVVEALPLDAAQTALDYCAGGGGKALALAARGLQVTAHDREAARMADLPERARRAGAQIALAPDLGALGSKHFDLVLCDAPCSGSGAWRRSPDGKWDLTPARLAELTAIQNGVLAAAQGWVAEGGMLAYVTCSILPEENTRRIAEFLVRFPDWQLHDQRHWLPGPGGDGFFLACLTRERRS